MSTITVSNLGKAYKQYSNRWARRFGWRLTHGSDSVESAARVGSADHHAARQDLIPARLAQHRQAAIKRPVLHSGE
jgi:hypothetical protein